MQIICKKKRKNVCAENNKLLRIFHMNARHSNFEEYIRNSVNSSHPCFSTFICYHDYRRKCVLLNSICFTKESWWSLHLKKELSKIWLTFVWSEKCCWEIWIFDQFHLSRDGLLILFISQFASKVKKRNYVCTRRWEFGCHK